MPVLPEPSREELPTPLAFAFARATSLDAGTATLRELAAALAEYATVVGLSLAYARGPLPSPVEEAMAFALNSEPGPRDWRALLRALGDDGAGAALEEGDPVAALAAWPGRKWVLAHVAAVRAEGEGALVYWRHLRGTAWPDLREERLAKPPAGLVPGLWLLDAGLEGQRVAVPSWLAWFDEARHVVRIFGGRAADGHWRYVTRTPMAEPVLVLDVARPGTPIWLRGLAPAHGPRTEATGDAPTLRAIDAEDLARGVAERLSTPTPEPAANGRLVLRVVAGRQLMSFALLPPRSSMSIGRSAATAQMAVQHGEVSRTHARLEVDAEGNVRVCDLGSANGTRLNGQRLGPDPTPMPLGSELRIGPVALRLERLGDDLVHRLEQIASFQGDTSRDPLTGLLQPTAVYNELPAALSGAAPVAGAVVDVDRLGALHAQHGQDAADAVFQAVARLVMFAVERPELCVRLHYGRILIALPGLSGDAALAALSSLPTTIHAHGWATDVTVSVAVGELHEGEALDTWVMRLGTGLNQGRLEGGRNRVFRV